MPCDNSFLTGATLLGQSSVQLNIPDFSWYSIPPRHLTAADHSPGTTSSTPPTHLATAPSQPLHPTLAVFSWLKRWVPPPTPSGSPRCSSPPTPILSTTLSGIPLTALMPRPRCCPQFEPRIKFSIDLSSLGPTNRGEETSFLDER